MAKTEKNGLDLLGLQYYQKTLRPEDIKDVKQILGEDFVEAYRDPLCCGYDCFVLGYIRGKQAERSRRKIDGNPERYYQRAAAEAANDLSPEEARTILAIICGMHMKRK